MIRAIWMIVAAWCACLPPFATAREPATVRVRFKTPAGPIVVAVDTRHAPATTKNFLAYIDDGRFDGIRFYRSARSRKVPTTGFIQGGVGTDARRVLPPFPQERTDKTGIRHLDMTISMARRAGPDSAGGNFFITVGAMPSMDANGAFPGYAAFGHVVVGQGLVRRILAQPTGGRMGGQMLLSPIRIITARRLDGVPHPTGRVKPWLEKVKPAQ